MYDPSMHVVASYLGFWGGAWVQGYHQKRWLIRTTMNYDDGWLDAVKINHRVTAILRVH